VVRLELQPQNLDEPPHTSQTRAQLRILKYLHTANRTDDMCLGFAGRCRSILSQPYPLPIIPEDYILKLVERYKNRLIIYHLNIYFILRGKICQDTILDFIKE
jgi:hypothetical protein